MKKLGFICILAMMLCGCQQAESPASTLSSESAQTQSQPDYKNTEEFADSDFCMNMANAGFEPLLFAYDEERYALERISIADKSYIYHFVNQEDGANVECTVVYDSPVDRTSALAEYAPVADGTMTEATVDGSRYEAYLFAQAEKWNVTYIPGTGYTCTVSAETGDSEKVLSYMNDLVLFGKAHWMTVFSDNPDETLEWVEHGEVSNVAYYDMVSAFLASSFCGKMREEGFTTYLLAYDDERFELMGMWSDANFYVYNLWDTVTNESLHCTISYNTYMTEIGQMDDNLRVPIDQVFTTAEKDGVTYDVYVASGAFEETPCYSVSYLPMEKYALSIRTSESTPEEALNYFHAFNLVPMEGVAD